MQSQIDQFYEKVDMQSHIDRLEQSCMKKVNHTDEKYRVLKKTPCIFTFTLFSGESETFSQCNNRGEIC